MAEAIIVLVVIPAAAVNALCTFWGWRIGIPIGRLKFLLITVVLLILFASVSQIRGGGAAIMHAILVIYGGRKLGNRLLDAGLREKWVWTMGALSITGVPWVVAMFLPRAKGEKRLPRR